MKKCVLLSLLVAVLCGLITAPGWAATFDVVASGSGTYVGASGLQAAIDAASTGDTINVETGTYSLNSEIKLNKAVTLKGSGNPTLDGQGQCRVINCTADATIDGFNISNGRADYGGGGISAWSTSCKNLTVMNCTFSGNKASNYSGGGIDATCDILTVKNCTFSNNTASNGGGMNLTADNIAITNCLFYGNVANGESSACGGGIYASGVNITIKDCTFADNTTNYGGGGIYISGKGISLDGNSKGNRTLANCTFSGNKAETIGGGLAINDMTTVMNCTFVDNSVNNNSRMYGGIEVFSFGTAEIINTVLWNTNTPYIRNNLFNDEVLLLKKCAFADGALDSNGVTATDTVTISDWAASHPASKVTVNGVEHTVFKLNASDTALINGGISDGAPSDDQIGNARSGNPDIGAVEYEGSVPNDNGSQGNNNDGENSDNGSEDNSDNGSSGQKAKSGNSSSSSGCDTGFSSLCLLAALGFLVRKRIS